MSKLNMGKLNISKLKVPPIKTWTFDQLKFAVDQFKSATVGPKDESSNSSIRSNLLAGLLVVLLLAGGVGGWPPKPARS